MWISTIALGLDYEETHGIVGEDENPPGPTSMEVFPLGIVPHCIRLIKRDIYNDGRICLHALEIIEHLARLLKEKDQPTFRQQLYDGDFAEKCTWVCSFILTWSHTCPDNHIEVLDQPGFTRRHAAINCLAAVTNYELVWRSGPPSFIILVMKLIEYASIVDADDVTEWSDARLAFQHNCTFTERYATAEPLLTKPMPREAFHKSIYARDTLQRCSIMAGEAALMVAARNVLFLERRLNHRRYLDQLKHHPELFDQLLRIPSRPNLSDAPHCQSNVLAMFILRLYIAPPGQYGHIVWLLLGNDIPLLDWASIGLEAFDGTMEILGQRHDALEALVYIYHTTSPHKCQTHHELYR